MYKTTFQNLLSFFIKSLTILFSSRNAFGKLFLTVLIFVFSSNGIPDWQKNNGKNFKSWEWEIIKPNTEGNTPWAKRAGLQALNHRGKFYIFGGRTPVKSLIPGESIIHGDVWRSKNEGKTWKKILESNVPFPIPPNHWANRAYFQAVSKGKYMYIIGGQDFNVIKVNNPDYDPSEPNLCPVSPCTPNIAVPCQEFIDVPFSQFFNDVWRSRDGINWENMTMGTNAAKRWSRRAGLSAVVFNDEIYVMGGSVNDDASIIGGPPTRVYYNDVWKSKNGRKWKRVTKNAPWAKRAGGIAVVKDGYMYMIGGEEGFTCEVEDPCLPPDQQAPCLDPPYFNDVWRTKDGKNWEEVTGNAEWIKRPGHQVVVAQDRLVLFGGFGLGPDNGISPANPSDIWISNKGKTWKKVSDAPWNAKGSSDIKYDFDAVVLEGKGKVQDAIYTFGGDRETFNFLDTENYKNVDNDVWKFSLPEKEIEEEIVKPVLALYPNYPNPFTGSTTIKYSIPNRSYVSINVYDRHGRFVSRLVGKTQNEGEYQVNWNARNYKNKPVRKGLYYATLWSQGKAKTIKMIKN